MEFNVNIEEMFERASWPVHFRSQLPFPCMVCECTTEPVGEVGGQQTGRIFHLQRCKVCGFVFVNDPTADRVKLPEAGSHREAGPDSNMGMAPEPEESGESIRHYEWRGVERVARHFFPNGGKWIDCGCGSGGLVRFAGAKGNFQVMGIDTGPRADRARAEGLPILREDELEQHKGTFDFATSIHVLERRVDPVNELIRIRSLLKRGGVLFFLTSNTARVPAPEGLKNWPELRPELHVSYFNHVSIEVALERGRFTREYTHWLPGFSDLVRYRALRHLGVQKRNLFEKAIPIRPLARLLAMRNHWLDYSVGTAR